MNLKNITEKYIAVFVKIAYGSSNSQKNFLQNKLSDLKLKTLHEKGVIIYDYYEIVNKNIDNEFDFFIHEIWQSADLYASHLNNKDTKNFLQLQYKDVISNIELSIWKILKTKKIRKNVVNQSQILLECTVNTDYSTIFLELLKYFEDNLSKDISCCGYSYYKKDINIKQNKDYRFCLIIGFDSKLSYEDILQISYVDNFIKILNLITNKSVILSNLKLCT